MSTTTPLTRHGDTTDVVDGVRAHYAAVARTVLAGGTARTGTEGGAAGLGDASAASCCADTGCCVPGGDAITRDLYVQGETDQLPDAAVLASLGCGNPTALAELREGEHVLDLGSGGGIDVLLSARRVGPSGFAWGVDMTDEMLELARRNAAEAGVTNVAFRKGRIEAIPLPDASVDVIISNCVVNLAGDKRAVLREAFRVLKPGGRFAVSDVVKRGTLPPVVARSQVMWSGCVAGALGEDEFVSLLHEAGFTDASVEFTRLYAAEDALSFLGAFGAAAPRLAADLDGKLGAAFVRAVKPATPG